MFIGVGRLVVSVQPIIILYVVQESEYEVVEKVLTL